MSLRLKFSLIATGYCTTFAAAVLPDQRWQYTRIPLMFALLEHPRWGPILVDTGITPRLHEATARWPYRVHGWLVPSTVSEAETAKAQLIARGIAPQDVRTIILTHFHPDHVGGLKDFPKARFLYFEDAYQDVRGKRGLAAMQRGFIPDLLPADFKQRGQAIDNRQVVRLHAAYRPFELGVDILGDGSLLAVHLPGHAVGQMGLCFRSTAGEAILLCADACWHSRAYRELKFPHWLTATIQAKKLAYRTTIRKLHRLHHRNPAVRIVPFHCNEAYKQYA